MQTSRLWFSSTLVSISWLGFGLLHKGGLPWSHRAPQIEVRTVPPGAEVLIDGKPVGLSDSFLDVPLAPPPGIGHSQLEVRVKKQGFEDARARLDPPGGEIPALAFTLKPLSAQLRLDGESSRGAEIWVRPGIPLKLPSATSWQLEPGLYEVWGVKGAQISERKILRLKPGQTQTLTLEWNPGAQAPSPP